MRSHGVFYQLRMTHATRSFVVCGVRTASLRSALLAAEGKSAFVRVRACVCARALIVETLAAKMDGRALCL
eukprot:2709265-Pyramimonas_sp.AAC.1